MKQITPLPLALLALFLLTSGLPATSQDNEAGPGVDSVQALLTERRETMREFAELLASRYQAGSTTLDELIRGQIKLLDAELALAETSDDRIRIHEERVRKFRQLEDMIARRGSTGIVTADHVLLAKAARLEAQIALAREQSARSN